VTKKTKFIRLRPGGAAGQRRWGSTGGDTCWSATWWRSGQRLGDGSRECEENPEKRTLKKRSKVLVAKSIGHSIRGDFKILLWKIRILPNGLMHVGAKVDGIDLCLDVNHWCHLFLMLHLFWRSTGSMNLLVVEVWHAHKNVPTKQRCGLASMMLWKILWADPGTIN